MKTISIRELKQNISAALREVQAGEIYEVTNHREVMARIMPAKLREHNLETIRAAIADIDALAAEIATYLPQA